MSLQCFCTPCDQTAQLTQVNNWNNHPEMVCAEGDTPTITHHFKTMSKFNLHKGIQYEDLGLSHFKASDFEGDGYVQRFFRRCKLVAKSNDADTVGGDDIQWLTVTIHFHMSREEETPAAETPLRLISNGWSQDIARHRRQN